MREMARRSGAVLKFVIVWRIRREGSSSRSILGCFLKGAVEGG